ncbi:MAG: hypothetical protein KAK04_24045 [Cyclobacteriaceae bacterium]|nr:hypothetical protein [Cyclobacteriaceae bacterium]
MPNAKLAVFGGVIEGGKIHPDFLTGSSFYYFFILWIDFTSIIAFTANKSLSIGKNQLGIITKKT